MVFPFRFVQLLRHLCSRAMKRKATSGQVADNSIELQVSLPSGRREAISVSQFGTVADLKIAAQLSLEQPFLRLVTADGRLLDPTETLRFSEFQDGGSLTAIAQQPKIAATWYAFALWCVGGDRIITWGNPDLGGDSSGVRDQLRNVHGRSVEPRFPLPRFWQVEA